MLYNFLFPKCCRDKVSSVLLFLIRLFFGILFFMHGLDKLTNFDQLSSTYPSVFGFGSYMTLILSVFTEFCCSLFLIFGLLTRLILLPMIVSMSVAFFVIHDSMMPDGELSLIYLIIFLGLYLTGPGRYSLDYLIDMNFTKQKK